MTCVISRLCPWITPESVSYLLEKCLYSILSHSITVFQYLCECQFDDNLKFKNIINEEDADTMRLQPIGRDKEGLMYWYQLDQDHNVRMYIEEQDDQDGSSWKCIVRYLYWDLFTYCFHWSLLYWNVTYETGMLFFLVEIDRFSIANLVFSIMSIVGT